MKNSIIKKKSNKNINYRYKKFNLFKSVFIVNTKNSIFYNFRTNIYGISDYKLNVLFFFSNCFKYVFLNNIFEFNLFGVKFTFSSLCLCINRELYKRNLFVIKLYKKIKNENKIFS